jgi:hypothetical protein
VESHVWEDRGANKFQINFLTSVRYVFPYYSSQCTNGKLLAWVLFFGYWNIPTWCLLLMFIFHEYNQFHSEGLKWHVGYTLSARALKEGWETFTCNKIAKKMFQCGNGLIRRGTFMAFPLSSLICLICNVCSL